MRWTGSANGGNAGCSRVNGARGSLNVIGHFGMICGNNVFRKHDVAGNEFPPCYCY